MATETFQKCEGCGSFAGVRFGRNRLIGRSIWLCLNCQHLVGRKDFRPQEVK